MKGLKKRAYIKKKKELKLMNAEILSKEITEIQGVGYKSVQS